MSSTAYIFLLLGIVLAIAGSNYLVDGASDIARRSGLSEFIIGLTIVGFGTSAPEMVVSFISAWRGNADMSVGNIVGSNIFNTCLILGLTAIILPVTITRNNVRRDIPINIFATLLLIFLGLNSSVLGIGESNTLSRIDGAVMLLCFAAYIWYSFKYDKGEADAAADDARDSQYRNVAIPALMVAGGLAALIYGGKLFVDNAEIIAHHFGWSDKFIGITVLALGTSLPELATCIVAAAKKKDQMALGNIIGSNVYNILLILGGSALIRPLTLTGINGTDMGFLLLSVLVLMISYFSFGKQKLDRIEGGVLVVMFAVYFYILLSAL